MRRARTCSRCFRHGRDSAVILLALTVYFRRNRIKADSSARLLTTLRDGHSACVGLSGEHGYPFSDDGAIGGSDPAFVGCADAWDRRRDN